MQVSILNNKSAMWGIELTQICKIGNADKVQTIRVNNYLSVTNWLEFPNTEIDFYAESIYDKGPFTTFDILPSDFVYVCGPETRKPCQVRKNGRSMIAGSSSQMTSQVVSPCDGRNGAEVVSQRSLFQCLTKT